MEEEKEQLSLTGKQIYTICVSALAFVFIFKMVQDKVLWLKQVPIAQFIERYESQVGQPKTDHYMFLYSLECTVPYDDNPENVKKLVNMIKVTDLKICFGLPCSANWYGVISLSITDNWLDVYFYDDGRAYIELELDRRIKEANTFI